MVVKNQNTRGWRAIRFIEKYCRIPEGDDGKAGQHVKLADFQIKFILDVYDNPHITDTAILSMARKNSKTATVALLVLVHLVGPEAILNSRIVSGALSRKQAAEVFNYAYKCVMFSPELSPLVRIVPSGKRLIGLPMNTEYEALSADGKKNQGNSPVVAILDEVGQIKGPRSEFVDAIVTAQGAYKNPLLFYISTQAAEDGDMFSILIDDALENKPPKTVCHVYAADPDCDVLDESQWKKANPALGLFRSEEDMRKNAEKAARMPSFENTFRNLNLNQRISALAHWMPKSIWEQCGQDPLQPDSRDEVFAGLDLSNRRDLTALVFIFKKSAKWHVHCFFWTPEEGLLERAKETRTPLDIWVKQGLIFTTPGNSVDLAFVARDIARIFSKLNPKLIGYDRWRIDVLQKEFDRQGIKLPLVEFGQGFKDATVGIEACENEFFNGNVCHGNNPVLTMCARNVIIASDEAGNRKMDKRKATGKIDGAVALSMAFGVMHKEIESKPVPKFQMIVLGK